MTPEKILLATARALERHAALIRKAASDMAAHQAQGRPPRVLPPQAIEALKMCRRLFEGLRIRGRRGPLSEPGLLLATHVLRKHFNCSWEMIGKTIGRDYTTARGKYQRFAHLYAVDPGFKTEADAALTKLRDAGYLPPVVLPEPAP